MTYTEKKNEKVCRPSVDGESEAGRAVGEGRRGQVRRLPASNPPTRYLVQLIVVAADTENKTNGLGQQSSQPGSYQLPSSVGIVLITRTLLL